MKAWRTLFDLTERVALVIGGGSGIGQAAAQGLAAFGAKCIVADLSQENADATADLICQDSGVAESASVDVRSTPSVAELIDGVVARHGRIDVLLTTPAVNLRKRMLEYEDAEFDRVIELNLKGTFRVARGVGRQMARQRGGSIILMSSMRAVNVEPGQSVYAATKAGICQMARGLAAELGPLGVRVNALAPGIVATPLTRPITSNPAWNQAYAERCALGRWADPSEMVGPVVFLASDASSYVTATTLFADAGWTAIDGRFVPQLS